MKKSLKILSVIISVMMVLSCIPLSYAADAYVHRNFSAGASQADIQEALDEARDNATDARPYMISLGDGEYHIDGALNIYSNTYFKMSDGATIIKNKKEKLNAGDNMLKLGAPGDDPASGYYYKNVTVEGGVWNENYMGNPAIKMAHGANITFRNTTIRNITDAHLLELAAIDGITIENCHFLNQVSQLGENEDANEAIQFDVLALPADLFSVCDNYFCYPEASEIVTNYVIQDLRAHNNTMNIPYLPEVRAKLEANPELKAATKSMLDSFKQSEKIDFETQNTLSKAFNVKSIILISAYSTNERNKQKRNLWETLEISSAFKINYPFSLVTNVVLTDTVNDVIMWSGKYTKKLSDSDGFFSAVNQTQAASQLEKIKMYYKSNVAQNISQHIYLRFFPRDVRTFAVPKKEGEEKPHFVPNALDHLITPQTKMEIEEGAPSIDFQTAEPEDLMFTF